MDIFTAGVVLIALGLLIAFMGKLFYRISIGIIGFGVGFILVNQVTREMAPDFSLILSIAGGILGIFLLAFIHRLSVFVLGAAAAIAILSVFVPTPSWILIGLAGVAGGIVGMVLEKPLIAVGTSLIGAYTCVTGVVLLVNQPIFVSHEDLWVASYSGEIVPREPLYIALFFLVWGVGLLYQLRSRNKSDKS